MGMWDIIQQPNGYSASRVTDQRSSCEPWPIMPLYCPSVLLHIPENIVNSEVKDCFHFVIN